MPVGAPLESRSIRPPSGSGVAALMLACCRARVLTSAVCANDDMTKIGRRVLSESSVARLVATPFGSIASRNQLTTSSHLSGSALAVSSRQAWMRACSCATVSRS